MMTAAMHAKTKAFIIPLPPFARAITKFLALDPSNGHFNCACSDWRQRKKVLPKFDSDRFRILALRAYKGSPVRAGLIGRPDERKKHRKPAHSAWPREILRLLRIIDMRLRHSARSHYARYVRGSGRRHVEMHRSGNSNPKYARTCFVGGQRLISGKKT